MTAARELTLRLFAPDGPAAPPGPPDADRWSLGQVYERLHLPEIRQEGRAAKTIADHRLHLRRFAQFWRDSAPLLMQRSPETWEDWGGDRRLLAAVELSSGQVVRYSRNPAAGDTQGPAGDGEPLCPLPIEGIDRRHLLVWRHWLLAAMPAGLGLSSRSANKHVATVRAVLGCAQAHELLASRPAVRQLRHRRAAPRLYLSLDELGRLYDACGRATWPQRTDRHGWLPYPAPAYWRTLLVLWFYYGLRTQELVRYEPAKQPLAWRSIRWQAETPSDEGAAVNEHGWLVYTPAKQARHKPDPLVLPLSAVAAAHLRSIEPPGVESGRPVIPFPRCNRSLYSQWRSLCDVAGVAPRPALDGSARRYDFSHLRKTCETHHNLHRRGIGPLITGHASRGGDDLGSVVAARHYDNPEQALVEAVSTLPTPPQFAAIFSPPDGPRQRLLF